MAGLDRNGAVFVAYPNEPDGTYGLAWHDPGWVCGAMGRQCAQFELLAFMPSRMFGHQDVWVYRRRPRHDGPDVGVAETVGATMTPASTP